jgi:hypothetical protein
MRHEDRNKSSVVQFTLIGEIFSKQQQPEIVDWRRKDEVKRMPDYFLDPVPWIHLDQSSEKTFYLRKQQRYKSATWHVTVYPRKRCMYVIQRLFYISWQQRQFSKCLHYVKWLTMLLKALNSVYCHHTLRVSNKILQNWSSFERYKNIF